MSVFKKATKKAAKLRLAIAGPAGAGKTYSALAIACAMGKRVAVIDTEHGSASLYANLFGFDVLQLESFAPQRYIDALKSAEAEGYDVVVIDSLTHAWTGKDGALEQVDNASKRSGQGSKGNSFTAWRDVTPQHNALVEAIIRCGAHVIATMRSKMAYEVEKDDRGKVSPRKIGMEPIQREGLSYEFGVFAEMDLDHNLSVSKTRCPALAGKVIHLPGAPLAKTLMDWLDDGEAVTEAPAPPPRQDPTTRTAPAADTTGVRDIIRGHVRRAKTMEELESHLEAIKKLTEIDREAIRPEYSKRKGELQRATAQAAEPPTAPAPFAAPAEATTEQKLLARITAATHLDALEVMASEISALPELTREVVKKQWMARIGELEPKDA